MKNFIELSNILGNSDATMTTVLLFNSARPIEKDAKGRFITKAIKPHKNGVIVEREYLNG